MPTFEQETLDYNQLTAELTAQKNTFNAAFDVAFAQLQTKANSVRALRIAIEAAVAGQGGTGPDPDPDPGSSAGVDVGNDVLLYDPVYVNGQFSAAQYRKRAMQMGTPEGIAYKIGPDPSYYGNDVKELPTLFKNTDKSLDPISYNYPGNEGIGWLRGCQLGRCGTYQIGGPLHPGEGGSFSMNAGQTLFIPSDRNALTGYMGYADMVYSSVGENAYNSRAELSWTNEGALGMGIDSVFGKHYESLGMTLKYAVDISRGTLDGWSKHTKTVWRDGEITSAGANTQNNKAATKLPANKKAVCTWVSNSDEFTFVGVWDTELLKSQIAVVACAGTPANSAGIANPADWEWWRGEWQGLFPGMPNFGNTSFMKVLGCFDLPPEMKCITSIGGSMGVHKDEYMAFHTDYDRPGFDLHDLNTRRMFREGGSRGNCYPFGGMLMVASKEEKKVAFIDLYPLVKFYREKYFAEADFGTVGLGAGQFPPTFAENATQIPVVVKVIDTSYRPTAVGILPGGVRPRHGRKRGFIAGQSGVLDVYDLGSYLGKVTNGEVLSGQQGDPNSIVLLKSIAIGRNPVQISFTKFKGDTAPEAPSIWQTPWRKDGYYYHLVITCRGEREVQVLQFNENFDDAFIKFKMFDSRLKDPVSTEDLENHTTTQFIMQVADYGGGQMYSFRYGPTIAWYYKSEGNNPGDNGYFNWTAALPPNGIPPTPTVWKGQTINIECGGTYPMPGNPFNNKSADVF